MFVLRIVGGRFGDINEDNCDWIEVDLLRFEINVIRKGCCLVVNDAWIDSGGVMGGRLKFLDGKVGVGGVFERVVRFCVWR